MLSKDDVLIQLRTGPLPFTFYKMEFLSTSSSKCTHSLQYYIPTFHFRTFQITLRMCLFLESNSQCIKLTPKGKDTPGNRICFNYRRVNETVDRQFKRLFNEERKLLS